MNEKNASNVKSRQQEGEMKRGILSVITCQYSYQGGFLCENGALMIIFIVMKCYGEGLTLFSNLFLFFVCF